MLKKSCWEEGFLQRISCYHQHTHTNNSPVSNTLLRQLSWLLVTLPSLILFDGLSVLAFCLHTDSHSRAENHSHKATVHQQTLTDSVFVNVCREVMLDFYFYYIIVHNHTLSFTPKRIQLSLHKEASRRYYNLIPRTG